MVAFSEKQKNNNVRFGILISYVSLAISVVLSLYFQRFILEKLGDSQYGLNAFATSITSWLTLMTFGLASTYIRFASLSYQREGDKGLNRLNGFYFLLVIGIFVLSLLAGGTIVVLFYSDVFYLPQYSSQERLWINQLLVVSSLSTCISFLTSFFSLFATLNYRFIWLRSIDIFTKVFSIVFSIIFVNFGGNIVTVSIVSACVQLAAGLLNIAYCIIKLKIRFCFHFEGRFPSMFKEVFVFSFFVFLNIIIDLINTSLGKVFLGFFATPGSVTLFALGMEFYTYASLASTSISNSFVPQINKLVAERKDDEVNNVFVKVSKIQLALMCLIFGGFLSSGKAFVFAWVGNDKIQSYYIGLFLLFAAIVPFSENVGIEIQRAYNKHQFRSVVYCFAALINTVISLLCILYLPEAYKPYGATIGLFCSLIVSTWVIINIFYQKVLHLSVKLYFRNFVLLFVSCLISACIVILLFDVFINLAFLNKWVYFLIRATSFAFLYVLFCCIIFNKEVHAFFRRKKEIIDEQRKS